MVDIESIKSNIIDWVEDNLGTDFTFRKYLLESIMFTIKSILNDDRETSIIEAPTGSGKSLISIIAAGVLSSYYNKTSYILCSDLFLWQQYADFIENKKLTDFGYIKGAPGNYTCFVNKQDMSCSKCRLAKVSYRQLKDKVWCERNFFSCVKRCKYMQDRFRAERSKVTLMTYQLWLHHMNLVNTNDGVTKSFPNRPVIFCDECHNIPDLVQQFCTPVLHNAKDTKKILDILNYAEDNDILLKNASRLKLDESFFKHSYIKNDYKITNGISNAKLDYHYNEIFDTDKLKEKITTVFDGLDIYYENADQVISLLKLMQSIFPICDLIDVSMEDTIQHESLFNTRNMDKSMITLSTRLSWFKTYSSNISSYINAIDKSGSDYLLLEVTEDDKSKERTYTFNCAKEDYLCNEYLLKHATNKVLLSATVGSHNSFDENIGTKYTKQQTSYFSKIPSTFDYSKSPIYYIPTYKMNYANKAKDFPMIQGLAVKIINANINNRGIIHTGSYENARIFYDNAPAHIKYRLYLYGNSKEKEDIMPEFKKSSNGILIGPTLTEGIDLPNDYCRFIIIMKVPYPNITSKLVKKKIELFPLWYNNVTSNIIIQSIGRGVRNEEDYCTTFILDGCFTNLYYQTKEQYPQHIQDRLKFITI